MSQSEHDRGSVVVIALVVMLLGSISVSALTAFNVAAIRSQLARHQQLALEREAHSALETAAASLRRSESGIAQWCPEGSIDVDGARADIECGSDIPNTKSRAGLVTTLSSSTVESQTLPTWSGGISETIRGTVVINTGTFATPGVSMLPDRRLQSASTWVSLPTSWTSFASSAVVEEAGTYPHLPPIPLYERPGSQTSIGTCNIYFPGRYLGTSSLIISSGLHYFTSGNYYFERSLVVSNGARVVMGEGSHTGCSRDSEAISTSRSPRRHEISGSGATVLFGGPARLTVQDSSLIINSRNGGTEPSIRTVAFGTSTSAVVIPPDSVRLDDGSIVPIATHSAFPPESATPISYKTSTLTPTTSIAVSITLNGSLAEANQFVVEGQIFVPHGGLHLASTKTTYRIFSSGGLLTARLTTSLPSAPTGAGSGFDIGTSLPEPSPTAVSIETRASSGRRSFTSRAVFDVSNSNWVLTSRTNRHRWEKDR